MEAISNFINSFPAWIAPAVIAIGCGIAAIVVFLIGQAQGYTRDDYRAVRARNRARRRNRRR